MQFQKITYKYVRLDSDEGFACYAGKSREASDRRHGCLTGLTIPILLTRTV